MPVNKNESIVANHQIENGSERYNPMVGETTTGKPRLLQMSALKYRIFLFHAGHIFKNLVFFREIK